MAFSNYQHDAQFLFAIDCIIFGYEEGELKLLLFKRLIEPSSGEWSLVGGWVNENESADDAAKRVLTKITGLEDIFLEQVQVFSKPKRDPGGRVISVIYYALVRKDMYDNQLVDDYGAQWISISELPDLIFDHSEMFQQSLDLLRQKASHALIGKQLLPEKFTLLQLRNLYNAIFQRDFDPGNFRKKVLSTKLLTKLDIKNKTESRKGAYYYSFRPEVDDFYTDIIVEI